MRSIKDNKYHYQSGRNFAQQSKEGMQIIKVQAHQENYHIITYLQAENREIKRL